MNKVGNKTKWLKKIIKKVLWPKMLFWRKWYILLKKSDIIISGHDKSKYVSKIICI